MLAVQGGLRRTVTEFTAKLRLAMTATARAMVAISQRNSPKVALKFTQENRVIFSLKGANSIKTFSFRATEKLHLSKLITRSQGQKICQM